VTSTSPLTLKKRFDRK